jgi:hypothetical protein
LFFTAHEGNSFLYDMAGTTGNAFAAGPLPQTPCVFSAVALEPASTAVKAVERI